MAGYFKAKKRKVGLFSVPSVNNSTFLTAIHVLCRNTLRATTQNNQCSASRPVWGIDFILPALWEYSYNVYRLVSKVLERVTYPSGNPDHVWSLRNKGFMSDGVFDSPSEQDVCLLA